MYFWFAGRCFLAAPPTCWVHSPFLPIRRVARLTVPDRAARILLTVIDRDPETVVRVLSEYVTSRQGRR